MIDGDGVAVSLIQSNASGFGSHLFEPRTGINLHNRGLGFSLEPGHPAEYGPGRRPPHTLTPALVTDDDGHVVAALGTMGGDSQPQVLLQILARVFVGSESPGRAISAGRFRLVAREHTTGFATWTDPAGIAVAIEGHAPDPWRDGLAAGTRGRAGTAVRPRVRPRPPHRARGWPPRGCRRPAPSDRTLLRHLSAGYRRVTVTAATCPKDMTYGPCGGVSADGACEVGPFACVFLDRDVVSWKETARHAAPPVEDALVVASRSRPLVVADLADRPLDAGSTRTAVAQLTSSVDAVLFGDTGWARVQLSPAYRASVIAAEGMRPWAGLNCRDRNRVALEGELAALADVGAAVHCVTGDHTAIGHRPEARAVFDLDSTELALARGAPAGVLVSVAENPVAPPIDSRPARLAEKVKAGAQVCFVNHPGSAERTRDFVQAAIDLGLGEVVFLVCVPVVFSEASLRLIKTFTGLALPDGLVEAVEAQGDPWTAGVREAVRFAEAVLDVPGVRGIDLSVAAPPGDEAAAVRACAAIAREVRAA